MRRVFLRVRLLDNHLWENTGCCTLVVWTVSVCRGRLGLTLTIMCAAVLLSLASLLFACYAVVSANMRQRDPVLKGTLLSRLYSGEDGSVPLPDDRDNLVQVRAMVQDGHTGRSILIKTPTDIHDQRRVADDGSRKAANIFILLNSNVSRLLNTTKSPTQRSAENKDHGTPSGTTFQESNRHVDERTTHENASSLRYAVVDAGSGATRNLPQAIIIGVKKGGTRALLEFIRLHPDVRAPGPETHFFDRNYHKGLDWYRRKMPPTIAGQITIEKTPSYFVTREVPRRVYDMSKDVKLIVVVRDPVTRAISDYTQAKAKRPKTKSFEQLAFLDNNTGVVDTSWGAIRIGVYAKHLERWLKYFPLEQIHFVNGEKLITDPAREIAKVQAFLGLKCIVTEKHFYFNENKGFPCLKKHEGSGKPHCLGKTKGRTHPNIQPRAVQRLRDFFHPFNVKFFSMVGTDFGWPVK